VARYWWCSMGFAEKRPGSCGFPLKSSEGLFSCQNRFCRPPNALGLRPLHNHSDYSLLDGAKPVARRWSSGFGCWYAALALTDHGGDVWGDRAAKLCYQRPGIQAEHRQPRCSDQRLDRMIRSRRRIRRYTWWCWPKERHGYRNLVKLTSLNHPAPACAAGAIFSRACIRQSSFCASTARTDRGHRLPGGEISPRRFSGRPMCPSMCPLLSGAHSATTSTWRSRTWLPEDRIVNRRDRAHRCPSWHRADASPMTPLPHPRHDVEPHERPPLRLTAKW